MEPSVLALFALGLAAVGLMAAFVWFCDRVWGLRRDLVHCRCCAAAVRVPARGAVAPRVVL